MLQGTEVNVLDPGLDPLITLPVIFQHLVFYPAIGIGDDKTKVSMPISLRRSGINDLADLDRSVRSDGYGLSYLIVT